MARYRLKHMKKSRPKSFHDWTGILIGARIDLLIGLLLHIIEKMMDEAQRMRGEQAPHIHIISQLSRFVKHMKQTIHFLALFFVCIGIAKLIFWLINHRKD